MINITYIYLIENCYNNPNKVYIGKTTNPKSRKNHHQRTYGRDIIFTIIDEINTIESKYWKPIETLWIHSFKNWGFDLQNINKSGGSGSSKWTQQQKNNRKGKGIGKNPLISLAKLNHPGICKPILKYSLDGLFIQEYSSITEASKLHPNCYIPGCLEDRQQQSGGYQWLLKKDYINPIIPKYIKKERDRTLREKPIIQCDLNNNYIQEYSSAKSASRYLNLNQPDISACCNGKIRTSQGFKWYFKKYYEYAKK